MNPVHFGARYTSTTPPPPRSFSVSMSTRFIAGASLYSAASRPGHSRPLAGGPPWSASLPPCCEARVAGVGAAVPPASRSFTLLFSSFILSLDCTARFSCARRWSAVCFASLRHGTHNVDLRAPSAHPPSQASRHRSVPNLHVMPLPLSRSPPYHFLSLQRAFTVRSWWLVSPAVFFDEMAAFAVIRRAQLPGSHCGSHRRDGQATRQIGSLRR
mmetsp:Transcript_12937/g.27313  ORF Transcript_12937/g.27313 Transcript_12937/m.27313 type:complete len:214 (-) Transcript_12937:1139-1780(-)